MSPASPMSPLHRHLARWMALAWRRECAAFGLDLVLILGSVALIGTLATAVSSRGDRHRLIWSMAFLTLITGLGWYRASRAQLLFGTPARVARTVARTPGPLGPAAAATRSRLLGATELMDTLEGRSHGPSVVGSEALIRAEVGAVAEIIERARVQIGDAVALPSLRPRLRGLMALMATVVLAALNPALSQAAIDLAQGRDARPPLPPGPLWNELEVRLTPPAYSGLSERTIRNPSGNLRALAGTEIEVRFRASQPSSGGALVVTQRDSREADPEIFRVELTRSTASKETTDPAATQSVRLGDTWTGAFTLKATTTWTAVLASTADAGVMNRSLDQGIALEQDLSPEIELAPTSAAQLRPEDTDRIDLRFVARDDFGIASLELCYSIDDGATVRIAVPRPEDQALEWRGRTTLELSEVPVESRANMTYWMELRDNDPGLGLAPLADPPGKMTRSAIERLALRDTDAEHATNLVTIITLRDQAVDLLARRMTSTALVESALPPATAIVDARAILSAAQGLLSDLATTIDALAVDGFVRERDLETLAGINERLGALHEAELAIHEVAPPSAAIEEDLQAISKAVRELSSHNRLEVTQLEDEIIRLDDLVDGMILARIEVLVARIEASQRRLIDLLEQLKAGDESVRPRIDQLEQRVKDDLRRLSEARAMMSREIGGEWLNLDAFRALEKQMARMDLAARLERNDIDGAIAEAKERMEEVKRLRGAVQESGEDTQARLSPEERSRMKMLRELGRLQDEEGQLAEDSRAHVKSWRDAVRQQVASDAAAAGGKAKSVREAAQEVNDARLGRDAREAWQDAIDSFKRLEQRSEDASPSALDLAEAARAAASGLQRAQAGAPQGTPEARTLERLARQAGSLAQSLEGELPLERDTADVSATEQMSGASGSQSTLMERLDALGKSEDASILPDHGKAAMDRAKGSMERAASKLGELSPRQGLREQLDAFQAIQEAIDSLRKTSPPPPSGGSSGESSTEADRDRSLRDALMEAMREDAPEGYSEAVERYYRELLR